MAEKENPRMNFKIPFTFSRIEKLKKKTKFLSDKIRYKKESKLSVNLRNCSADISREEYLAISIRSFTISFIFLFAIATTALALLKYDRFIIGGLAFAVLFSGFVFFSQMAYPKIYVTRRQRNIEKNLISALQDMSVQLNSGIPLFNIMTNISEENYGELSEEFKMAVKKINSGMPEEEVLEELAKKNPSVYFRRTLWQISNGLNSGGDMAVVVRDSTKSLNEEQMIQIQNYGNTLNPLIVFYMLISVIIPALSITFLTIIASMIGLAKNMTMLIFIGLFVFVVLIQIMFLGMIKSRRPSLL